MRSSLRGRQDASPSVITQAEAADRLGVTDRTIRRWVAEGRIRAYRVGPRLVRVDSGDVDAMLAPIPTFGGDAA